MQVIRLIAAGQLDQKIARLLLSALPAASVNLRRMQLEPGRQETVVIDPKAPALTGVGDDSWSRRQFKSQWPKPVASKSKTS